MSQEDELKEEISWLKVTYAILVAIDVSLIAWIAQNYDKTDTLLIALSCLLVILIGAAVIRVNQAAYRRMKKLGDL
jgi:Mn2+/Fe2+ NRAMP family transporter